MKCKKCLKEYTNPYVNTGYCSKACENAHKKNMWYNREELFNNLFWKIRR
jgi:hypothetical protein